MSVEQCAEILKQKVAALSQSAETKEAGNERKGEKKETKKSTYQQVISDTAAQGKGLLFLHDHLHVGSYDFLAEIMPILAENGITDFAIEQPPVLAKAFERFNKTKQIAALNPEIDLTKEQASGPKGYSAAYKNFLEAVGKYNITLHLVGTAPRKRSQRSGMRTLGLLQRITVDEKEILDLIKKSCGGKKWAALLGRLHVHIGAELQVPSFIIRESAGSRPYLGKPSVKDFYCHEYPQATVEAMLSVLEQQAKTALFLLFPEKDKTLITELATNHTNYIKQLPNLAANVIEVPQTFKTPSSCSNRNLFFATAAVAAVVGTVLTVAWTSMGNSNKNS